MEEPKGHDLNHFNHQMPCLVTFGIIKSFFVSPELVHFVICVDANKMPKFLDMEHACLSQAFFLHFLSASAPWNKHKCFIAHDGWFVICVDALTQMYSVCLSNQVRISFPCHQKKADRTHSRKQTNELLTCHQKRERRENHKYEYLSLIGAWSCSLLMPSSKSDDSFAKGGIYEERKTTG